MKTQFNFARIRGFAPSLSRRLGIEDPTPARAGQVDASDPSGGAIAPSVERAPVTDNHSAFALSRDSMSSCVGGQGETSAPRPRREAGGELSRRLSRVHLNADVLALHEDMEALALTAPAAASGERADLSGDSVFARQGAMRGAHFESSQAEGPGTPEKRSSKRKAQDDPYADCASSPPKRARNPDPADTLAAPMRPRG